MPFRNITNDFLQVVRDHSSTRTLTKRKKPSRAITVVHGIESVEKAYVAEAQNILNHIHTLTRMLTSIRAAYLNMDSRNSSLWRQGSRVIELSEGLANIRNLTNEERDQIDFQASVILTRCSDRIKEMESLEKRRAEVVASKMNPLTRLLPVRLRQDEASLSSDVLAAHHASITWYLSRRLTEASQTQKELQEERVRRQLERTRSLGSGAAREVLAMQSQHNWTSSNPSSLTDTASPGSWLGTTIGVAIGASYSASSQESKNRISWSAEEEEEGEEIELSASQIMQFETENAAILKNVQDTLQSVNQAEARLRDISTLQMELVTRLTQQTELTEQLYEDALTTTSTVEKGNAQLREAKRRAKDGRIFILLFLIGASFSLLFLHYY